LFRDVLSRGVKDIATNPKGETDMNTTHLIGNLGAAPEIKESKGTTYARFRIAINERWVDDEGKRQHRADWFQVVAFNGLAKSIAPLGKGDRVAIVGRLRCNSYERDGETRTAVEVHAQVVEFLRVKAFEEREQQAQEQE
jgi:single-strand DNA-binding protein